MTLKKGQGIGSFYNTENGNSKVCGTGSDPKTLAPGLHGSNQIIALCIIGEHHE